MVQKLYPRVLKCAQAGALATETKLEVVYLGGTMEILPNDTLAQVAKKNLTALNDLKYDDEEMKFAVRLQETFPDKGRRSKHHAVFDVVRQVERRQHRCRRCVVGGAGDGLHHRVLGAGHAGSLVASGGVRRHDDREEGDEPRRPHARRDRVRPVHRRRPARRREGRTDEATRRPQVFTAMLEKDQQAAARLPQPTQTVMQWGTPNST